VTPPLASHRSICFPKPCKDLYRVQSASADKPRELNDIKPTLAVLDLCNPAMWNSEAQCEIALGESSVGTCLSQSGSERRVLGCMNGLPHRFHDRSVL
jgi:hypothetical protein